jgi:small-conductance mechanosensitive channel
MNAFSFVAERLSGTMVPNWERILLGTALFLAGYFALRLITAMIVRGAARGLRDQHKDILRKLMLYVGSGMLFIVVLNLSGVSVGGLLGAAGVVGIAVGIASQASLSNIISGLFLVSERFFEIGDTVRIGEHTVAPPDRLELPT